MNLKNICGLAAILLLAACTNFQRPQSNTLWHEQREWQQFETDGRMSVKVGDKGYPAAFYWLRENGVETFDINTPLGATVLRLCQDSEGVLAVDQEGRVYQARTAEQLSEQLLGYSLPVQYLSVWLHGEWVKHVPYRVESDGSLLQAGWKVSREVDENNNLRVLMVEQGQSILRMVFGNVVRKDEPLIQAGRCEYR